MVSLIIPIYTFFYIIFRHREQRIFVHFAPKPKGKYYNNRTETFVSQGKK